MIFKSNPSRKSGFSYFFRNKRKTLFIKKPGGRKYHRVDLPARVDPLKFLNDLMIEVSVKDYRGFSVYFTKNGELTNRKASADTIWIKTPRGRVFKPFEITEKLLAREVEQFTKFLIAKLRQGVNLRKRKRDEKKVKKVEEVYFEEHLVPETEAAIEYEVLFDSGYYTSSTYTVSEYEARRAIAIPQIKITKHNVNTFLEYIETFGMGYSYAHLKDMGVREGQSFRIRIMGGGMYERRRETASGRIKKEDDVFGFSLSREDFTEEGFESFAEDFMSGLRSKLTGSKSYLARAKDGYLTFEGFHVEIYF